MNVSKPVSARTLKSGLGRVDSHMPRPSEYKELAQLTGAMLGRGTVKKAGRLVATNPRRQAIIRLRESVLAAWKATGPGWHPHDGTTQKVGVVSDRACPTGFASVDKDAEWDAQWERVAEQREAELASGAVAPIALDDALARLRERFTG